MKKVFYIIILLINNFNIILSITPILSTTPEPCEDGCQVQGGSWHGQHIDGKSHAKPKACKAGCQIQSGAWKGAYVYPELHADLMYARPKVPKV